MLSCSITNILIDNELPSLNMRTFSSLHFILSKYYQWELLTLSKITLSKITMSKAMKDDWKISESHYINCSYVIFTYNTMNWRGGPEVWRDEIMHWGVLRLGWLGFKKLFGPKKFEKGNFHYTFDQFRSCEIHKKESIYRKIESLHNSK